VGKSLHNNEEVQAAKSRAPIWSWEARSLVEAVNSVVYVPTVGDDLEGVFAILK
jgi:hypothetical protein